jgi:hypothetical protein
MGGLFMLLGVGFFIACIVCHIMLLIAAFQDEVWKGILGFFCGLYLLIFAFTDYDGDNKTLVILVWLLGGAIGSVLWGTGRAMMHGG